MCRIRNEEKLNVNSDRLVYIFKSFAAISACLAVIFFAFDPEAGLNSQKTKNNEIVFENVFFQIIKSPRGIEPRVVIYKNGSKIFSASCDGVADLLCVQEYYRDIEKADYLLVVETSSGKGLIKGVRFYNLQGVLVSFNNLNVGDQVSARSEVSIKRVLMFFIFAILFCLIAIFISKFRKK